MGDVNSTPMRPSIVSDLASHGPIQVRSEVTGLRWFSTLAAAVAHADANPDVWKISFSVDPGFRVRLLRRGDGWVASDLFEEAGIGDPSPSAQ